MAIPGLGTIKSIFDTLKEPANALGRFFNPDRRREARKDVAIESARELFKILRKQTPYSEMTDAQRAKWEVHFQKRFNACEQG